MIDYRMLKSLAKASMSGPWEVSDEKLKHFWRVHSDEKLMATIPAGGDKNTDAELVQRRKTAEFIAAANPQAVLELIDEVEAFRKQVAGDRHHRRERQAQGIERAKAEGKYQGRPIDADLHKRVKELLKAGMGVRPTARHAKCSTTTVLKIRAEIMGAQS